MNLLQMEFDVLLTTGMKEDKADPSLMVDKKGGQETAKVDKKGGQETRNALLSLIRENPSITSTQMAEQLGINRSAVTKHLKKMQETGLIQHVGPNKGGHWEVASS